MRAAAGRILAGLGVRVRCEADGEDAAWVPTIEAIDTDALRERRAALSGFMREREVLLEHVMVCEFLREPVPLTQRDVWTSFRLFASVYVLHKGALLGYFERAPHDEELVDLLVHRKVIHSYRTADTVLARGEQVGLTDLGAIVAALRG